MYWASTKRSQKVVASLSAVGTLVVPIAASGESGLRPFLIGDTCPLPSCSSLSYLPSSSSYAYSLVFLLSSPQVLAPSSPQPRDQCEYQ